MIKFMRELQLMHIVINKHILIERIHIMIIFIILKIIMFILN